MKRILPALATGAVPSQRSFRGLGASLSNDFCRASPARAAGNVEDFCKRLLCRSLTHPRQKARHFVDLASLYGVTVAVFRRPLRWSVASPAEARSISVHSRTRLRVGNSRSGCSMRSNKNSEARRPWFSVGWLTVVRAGTRRRERGMLSNPINETSSGTRMPASEKACMTPSAV